VIAGKVAGGIEEDMKMNNFHKNFNIQSRSIPLRKIAHGPQFTEAGRVASISMEQ
jgi:hypothetical protein